MYSCITVVQIKYYKCILLNIYYYELQVVELFSPILLFQCMGSCVINSPQFLNTFHAMSNKKQIGSLTYLTVKITNIHRKIQRKQDRFET